ncbi:hypothetical protein H1R20_g10164, partial [Candolleomyces eurysporus]
MPTATTTITATNYPSPGSLKSGVKMSPTALPSSSKPPAAINGSSSTSAAPLRSLYTSAARAFLHRDIRLTYSLIESAFQLLKPPVLVHDALLEHRRKWDILRITLETTIYSDPPSIESLPESLRQSLTESPHTLMTSIYARSAVLFTPSNGQSQKASANPGYLPPNVLITLLYSSLKLDCPDIGRMMAEEWLSRRETPLMLNESSHSSDDSEEGGYDKVLEIYCLHILPKLGQWDYAKEFLQCESELSDSRREVCRRCACYLDCANLVSVPDIAAERSTCRSLGISKTQILARLSYFICFTNAALIFARAIFFFLVLSIHNLDSHDRPFHPKRPRNSLITTTTLDY